MLNQLVLVGRLVKDIEVKELESGKRIANAVLAVPRSFKNENGEYDTDFIDVVIWNSIADNTAEYCRKGDLIGIKGRLETNNYETENGEYGKATQVIAEKVTFLSSNKREED
jgi:single-strand DNA-binding protein